LAIWREVRLAASLRALVFSPRRLWYSQAFSEVNFTRQKEASPMKLIASAVLSLLALVPIAAQAPVPVGSEPRHHLKFENQYVRVFDVQVPPGDTTLFHIHANDYLFVSIGDANLKAEMLGGQPGDLIVKDGDCRYSKAPITHRVTNIGKDLFRNITIEVLKSPGIAADPQSKEIPGHTLVLDNDRVHVERVVIEPGGSIPTHTHSRSGLGVAVSAAEIKLESPGQSPRTVQFRPGDFQWIDGPQTHSMKNTGKTRFEAVHIEWK
jgi:quercetin dioxygenase-like cupin family protein